MYKSQAYRNALNTLATDAQWGYIKRLMNEAFAHNCKNSPNLDVHHMPTYYSKQEASSDIQKLLALKANGWK